MPNSSSPSLLVALGLLGIFALSLAEEASSVPEVKPTNLLLIMFDDLRPELSIYGREHMITPNFERLAKRSVVFDYSFCQVAVCNPSRDSLMTGLRPDSVGTYNFGHSYWPHLSLPTQLIRSGYNTAGIGKLFHWESNDRNIWSFDSWDNKWYDYQGIEGTIMNSSTMPDKLQPEHKFRDYEFVERAITTWDKMRNENKPYMLALGFKLPHLALHVPYKYYAMYKNDPERMNKWKLNKKELRFPVTTPEISYRCCAEGDFQFMNAEGALRANRTLHLGDINHVLPEEMHDELMLGYCAGTTFVDMLLGKLLDVMDEKNLWENTTVVLSADHGMHNGEKGIWEKWTLFEESTRVPLLISHPASPYKGEHYKQPVESIDIYATLNELLKLPVEREKTCGGLKCKPLQGKSLAPVLLGKTIYEKNFGPMPTFFNSLNVLGKLSSFFGSTHSSGTGKVSSNAMSSSVSAAMPVLEHNFAISQAIRCILVSDLPKLQSKTKSLALPHQTHTESSAAPSTSTGSKDTHKAQRSAVWRDCDYAKNNEKEFVVLGYAMRTPEYRYIAYFNFNRVTQLPDVDSPPFEEELYDHKNETLSDFTHRETFNLAVRPSYVLIIQSLRAKLVKFIKEKVKFGDH